MVSVAMILFVSSIPVRNDVIWFDLCPYCVTLNLSSFEKVYRPSAPTSSSTAEHGPQDLEKTWGSLASSPLKGEGPSFRISASSPQFASRSLLGQLIGVELLREPAPTPLY